jgi:hypothetical protein
VDHHEPVVGVLAVVDRSRSAGIDAHAISCISMTMTMTMTMTTHAPMRMARRCQLARGRIGARRACVVRALERVLSRASDVNESICRAPSRIQTDDATEVHGAALRQR